MDERKRINIVVGGTFHFPMMLNNLLELGYDVHVYTSTPKFKFKTTFDLCQITTVLKPFQLFQKITNIRVPRWADAIDEFFFDYLVSRVMRRCDILIAFQNAAIYTSQKAKAQGSIVLLDRACPHAIEVSKRLYKEAKKINVHFEMPKNRQLTRYAKEYEVADLILVPSDYSLNSFIRMGVSKEKLVKVPLSAKIDVPKGLPDHPKKLVFGMIGSDFLRKGVYYLIKAFDIADVGDAKLILNIPKKSVLAHHELKKIVDGNQNIEFCGYLEDVNDFYKMCSVFCLPSIDDGFGMVVCEAMANGLPVITTDCVGASEFIQNSRNGFVVKAGDTEALARSLTHFYEEPESKTIMGKNGREIYLAYDQSGYSYKSQLRCLLQELLEGR